MRYFKMHFVPKFLDKQFLCNLILIDRYGSFIILLLLVQFPDGFTQLVQICGCKKAV